MKRTIIAVVMLVVTLAFTLNLDMSTKATAVEQVTAAPCGFKTALPSALSLKVECDSCCDAGHAAYEYCRDFTNKSTCECIQAGYEACMDGGCGPCQCCGDWLTRGKWHGCINDEKEWKRGTKKEAEK